jgi:HSP20 family protein
MKLMTRNNTPANLNRVTDFDDWFRNPFAALPTFGRFFEMPDFYSGATSMRLAADIHEDKDHYYARFEVPGVKKEDVKVELNNSILTVSADRKEKTAEGESSYTLSRSVSVPEGVNGEAIFAKLEDGVLTVTLPKAEHRKPRSIEVG